MNVILNVYHVSFAKAWLYESRGFHFYDVKNVSIKLLVLNLFFTDLLEAFDFKSIVLQKFIR